MPSDSSLAEFFGKPIFTYTRAQAIDDAILNDVSDMAIDVSDMAKEAGFRVPVALSSVAWDDCFAWAYLHNDGSSCDDAHTGGYLFITEFRMAR